jgi:predicted nucleic acid-binding protein
MNVLIDLNVLLDISLKRQPWVSAAQRLVDAHHQGKVLGCVTASAVPTLFYLMRRAAGLAQAFAAVDMVLSSFYVLEVDAKVLERARSLVGSDFEDLVHLAAALVHRADAIVTRDPKGFAASSLPVYSPDALLTELMRQGILPSP